MTTDTLATALAIVERGYRTDYPVRVTGETSIDDLTVGHAAAVALSEYGLVRPSLPEGRFALLTDAGKARFGL